MMVSVAELVQLQTRDRELLSEISAALAEAARRSGDWLACRPGCTQCCIGPFVITALDALRLKRGLAELEISDPARAARIRGRAVDYVAAIADNYPGLVRGELFDEDVLPESMDDVACPALDPDSGLCDLYEARPVTCRTFGPVTRVADGALAACELCYVGVAEEQMATCAVEIDPDGLEGGLLEDLARAGSSGMTIVACALASKDS
jgi:Fe-S-cluster containining protein